MATVHLKYSKTAKKVIRTYLRDHYPLETADNLLQEVNNQYELFLLDLPDLGGRKNHQAQSVYDCIALFALYEVLPEKPALGVFEALVNMVFVPAFDRISPVNLNHTFFQKLAFKTFSRIEASCKAHEKDWPGNYHMKVLPYDPQLGIRYQFTSCPIADFARKHGYLHLMPAMCNPDYPSLAAIHAGLIRTKTCAKDDCCDYWITGSRSPHLKEHPVYKDSEGFLRNK